MGSMMTYKHISLIFGITPSSLSRVIRYMLQIVIKQLKKHPEAEIRWPNERKMARFSTMIFRREPRVSRVIGFMDGLSLKTECSSDHLIQNAHYNGYQGDTAVNNVFVFGPDGKVLII